MLDVRAQMIVMILRAVFIASMFVTAIATLFVSLHH
jgi:hypothetical protein